MTDGTGGEKSKDSQAVWQKWDISRESQLIIAESRWGKKKKDEVHDKAENRKFGAE